MLKKTFAIVLSVFLLALCSAGIAGQADKPATKDETLTLAALPEAARNALKKLMGDNAATSLTRRGKKDAVRYEAHWTADGKKYEAVVKADGTLILTETEIDAKDVPAVVQNAATKAAAEGATITYIKIRQELKDKTFFEVKATKDAKLQEFVFDAAGKEVDDDTADEETQDDSETGSED